jgi:hypothetical protein
MIMRFHDTVYSRELGSMQSVAEDEEKDVANASVKGCIRDSKAAD